MLFEKCPVYSLFNQELPVLIKQEPPYTLLSVASCPPSLPLPPPQGSVSSTMTINPGFHLTYQRKQYLPNEGTKRMGSVGASYPSRRPFVQSASFKMVSPARGPEILTAPGDTLPLLPSGMGAVGMKENLFKKWTEFLCFFEFVLYVVWMWKLSAVFYREFILLSLFEYAVKFYFIAGLFIHLCHFVALNSCRLLSNTHLSLHLSFSKLERLRRNESKGAFGQPCIAPNIINISYCFDK